ncbi:putative glycosyltransferase EpsF [Oceanobacillus oncorhynchi subsp. incaldanensis]|uniref:glycosyltransferase family 1 protein n=1 Tax=Oceanobacillus oncorhynchi TaxID=545501 RepID=UPI001B0BDF09|nr:glycosyltransferase family 1 protein [Oceanobacillus oncorhynchi]GIO19642.1 putative glycosyltransferase EpsF [Oceanobacillus oncorhynchi subsp. incaldanensis]
MRKYPIRILHVFGRLDRGGAETMVMNLYRNIDKTKVQFDFIIHTKDECDYSQEIRDLGGNIYNISRYNGKNHLKYKKEWIEFFEQHREYKVVHAHMRSTASIFIKIAKKYNITTIAHSHNTSSGKGISAFYKNLLQRNLKSLPDYKFACSLSAGSWLFGEKAIKKDNFYIVPNSIDMDKFEFNIENRKERRKKLSLDEESIIVGTVGRLTEQKNPFFILQVMKYISNYNKNIKFLWIGTGELHKSINEKINELKLQDNIILLGSTPKVEDYLQAMDIFLLPSLWEGLGIVVIEAQASGLPCIVSENIPQEAIISDLVEQVELSKGFKQWGKEILNIAQGLNEHSRKQNKIDKELYDVNKTSKWIENFYLHLTEDENFNN